MGSWETLQPNFIIGVMSSKLEPAEQDWGLYPPGPPTPEDFSPSRAIAPIWALPTQLSSPGPAGHCSCPFRPKGHTAFPLLLRTPHVTKGCSNILTACPDLCIVPFCQLPSIARTKFPSLSNVYSFQGSFFFLSLSLKMEVMKLGV